MSDALDSKEGTLFALDEPGPAMDLDAIDLVFAAIDVFEEQPYLHTTIRFVHSWEGEWKYNLTGMCLKLAGFDLRILDPDVGQYALGTELVLELGFSTFDYYALGEMARGAESPGHLRELFEVYIEFPCRVDPEIRNVRPREW